MNVSPLPTTTDRAQPINPCMTKFQQRARKNYSLILSRLASVGQRTAASALNIDEATMSRLKSDGRIEQFAKLLAVLEIKTVPESHRCVKAEDFEHVMWLASKGMEVLKRTEDLLLEDPE